MAIRVIKVDRRGRNEAEYCRDCGPLLEEVAERNAPLRKLGHGARQFLELDFERTVLRADVLAEALPKAEHGMPPTADPEECEAAGTACMRISARRVDMALQGQLQAEDRRVELERAVEVGHIQMGLEHPAHDD